MILLLLDGLKAERGGDQLDLIEVEPLVHSHHQAEFLERERNDLVGGDLHRIGQLAHRDELVDTNPGLLERLFLGYPRCDDVAIRRFVGTGLSPCRATLQSLQCLQDVGLHLILIDVVLLPLLPLLAATTWRGVWAEGARDHGSGRRRAARTRSRRGTATPALGRARGEDRPRPRPGAALARAALPRSAALAAGRPRGCRALHAHRDERLGRGHWRFGSKPRDRRDRRTRRGWQWDLRRGGGRRGDRRRLRRGVHRLWRGTCRFSRGLLDLRWQVLEEQASPLLETAHRLDFGTRRFVRQWLDIEGHLGCCFALGLDGGLSFLLGHRGGGAPTSDRLAIGRRRGRRGCGGLATSLLGRGCFACLALLALPADTNGGNLVGLERRQVTAHEDVHLAQRPHELFHGNAEFGCEVVHSTLDHSSSVRSCRQRRWLRESPPPASGPARPPP